MKRNVEKVWKEQESEGQRKAENVRQR